MFDAIKKLKQLKEIKDSMKKEKVEVEENGIKIVMNGEFEVEELKLNPDISASEQEAPLKSLINKARTDIQKKVAANLMNSGMAGQF